MLQVVSRGRAARLAQARVRVHGRHYVIMRGARQTQPQTVCPRSCPAGSWPRNREEHAGIGMDGTGTQGRRLIRIQVRIGHARMQSILETYATGSWKERALRPGHWPRRRRTHGSLLMLINVTRTLHDRVRWPVPKCIPGGGEPMIGGYSRDRQSIVLTPS